MKRCPTNHECVEDQRVRELSVSSGYRGYEVPTDCLCDEASLTETVEVGESPVRNERRVRREDATEEES